MSGQDEYRHTASVGRGSYVAKCGGVAVDRGSLNELVMNFLEIEGFKEAAEAFRKESGAGIGSVEAIQDRGDVNECLAKGAIEDAAAKIEATFPDVLQDADIAFRLKHQQLLEYVRQGDVERTLNYARDAMASSELSPANLERMEEALCLIAFEDPSQCQYAPLLGPAQRQETSSIVNAAILRSTGRDPAPMLLQLLRVVQWMEHALANNVQFPHVDDLVRAPFRIDMSGNDEMEAEDGDD
eukprot:TRINITY_DN13493_c0_g1_i1.p2 TRINITY_DN13493_c0_g1~~TRINITY_DN13493_c0_g1_i1.p2  ORF type:complete len:260 (+),score=118.42 TRINITY_DN13493_c0_g1_i1:60-782(+)